MPNNSVNTMLPEPQQRNITVVLIFMVFSLAVVCYTCYTLHKENYSKTLAEVVFLLIMAMTVLVAIEVINRICYFTNELIKINVEHGGSIIRVFQTVTFNISSSIIVISSIVLFLVLIYNTELTSLSSSRLLNLEIKYMLGCFFALVFSFFMADIVNIRECRAQKIENLNRLGGIDYGSSMACSYFYGYLKIILPADGKDNEGLIGRIEKYEANNNVTVPVKKLFILIPASFYIPPKLEISSNKTLEPTLNKLLFIKVDRAGTVQREYKNTIYKIHPGGLESGKTPIYVVTEGATPMLTFFEVQQQKHRYSDVYTEYKREIGKLFYRTLEQLLNDNPDCRDVCELVYYEDYDEKGKSVNPGEILLRRIQEETQLLS